MFRMLDEKEQIEFKESAKKMFSISVEELEIIHPTVRLQMIRLIQRSLEEQMNNGLIDLSMFL